MIRLPHPPIIPEAVTGELRAQRREPCRREPNDCRHADDGWCGSDECNGDGTRWVTVGTLASAAFYHGEPRSLYVIEEES